MSLRLKLAVLVAWMCCVPDNAFAQLSALGSGEIGGVVRDASGGVLAGVSVEAASPAMIEKGCTTVTDGTGEYVFPGLRPGAYTMTFTLNGFVRLVRQDILVEGPARRSVDVTMKIG